MTQTAARRPSLPVGHPVSGFGGIEKALHVATPVELYSLAGTPARILVHVRNDVEPRSVVSHRLMEWWRRLGKDRLVVESEIETANAFQAVLHVRGTWLGARSVRDTYPDERELIALVRAMCDVGALAGAAGTEPSISSSLVWWDNSGIGTATPLYVIASEPDEARMVQAMAALVYEHASGIAVFAAKGPIRPLSKWVKTAGPLISDLLGRCLSDGADRIRTIAEVNTCVERGSARIGTRGSAPPAGVGRAGVGLAGVAGMRELRELLVKEVVRPIRDPEPFKKYGLTIPNGILLFGPPGCGKTWIARKLAEEVGHYFVEIIPSEVGSPYIHDSVLRIRELFDNAAEHAPAIVFIDEFEALAPSRADMGGQQQYKSEEVNEFLVHLNACADKGIFVIAATNEPQKIDPAIRRTGRLDKLIYVGPPDAEARTEMLRMHLSGRPVAANLDYSGIAGTLSGYSASDIKFLVDQAARAAIEAGAEISEALVLDARARAPGSVSADDEARYSSFVTRG